MGEQIEHGITPNGVTRRDVIVKGGVGMAALGAAMYFSSDIGEAAGNGIDTVVDTMLPMHEEELDSEVTTSGALEDELTQEFNEALEVSINGETAETPNVLQWAGSAVFAHGIKELYKGNHITQWHYGAQGALIALERRHLRDIGDEEALQHVDDELAATVLFTGIIEGTVVAAEGMTLDIEEVYKRVKENDSLEISDRIAILTSLASMQAPLFTTVGASGMSSDESMKVLDKARTFADEMSEHVADKVSESTGVDVEDDRIIAIKALLQSHISDKAGFPFVGDPPFIATIERFGLNGLAWQSIVVGMAPAVRSLFYTNTGITEKLMDIGAIDGDPKDAGKIARSSMKRNFGFVSGVMGKTLTNLAIPLKNKQSQDGTQHDFLGSFADKLDGFRDLLFEDHIESHGHENEGSRIIDSDYDQFITGTLAGIPSRSSERAHERISDKRKFADFMRSNDFEGLSEWLSQKGLNTAANEAVIAGALEVEKEVSTREGTDGDDVGKWNPLAVYRRVTDVERMQDALGHGFTDVLDVFPFQSASMIFVSPVFKWGVDKFDTLTEKIPISPVEKVVNDLGKYAGIAAFSSVADNLVGVREGYKFTEENPSIALIAGIQGGMLLPPGNMANVVEFPLNVYPLEEAKTQIGKIHARPLAEGFVWSQILGLADKAGIVSFPKPTDTEDHGSDIGETGSALPSSKTSRRDMLKSFFN